MGLVTGGLNGRRFRTSTLLPNNFRDQFKEQLNTHAFTAQLEAADPEPRIGWVDVFEPANTEFELNTFLFDRFLCVSLRIDKKRVNGRYFKIALANRIEEVLAERAIERLKKEEREAISDALEAELYRRALPTVATCDLAWDIHTGDVIVFNTSDKTIELVRELFEETFDMRLRPERMADWLTDKFDRDEVTARADRFLPGSRGSQGSEVPIDGWHPDDPLENVEQPVAADFLTWLWLQSESSDGHFRVIDSTSARARLDARLEEVDTQIDDIEDSWNDITETLRHADLTLWVENKLKLQDVGAEQPDTTILIGVAPTATPAARQDMSNGKRPIEVRLGMKLNDLTCQLTLQATPGGLQVAGLKLPFEVRDGQEEKIYERMLLLDLIHTTLKQLFQQFYLARTSDAWDGRVLQWLREDLAAK